MYVAPRLEEIPMNPNQRRLEVSDAAWRVIVRDGLDRTSMRAIAKELGCTTGVVTHYFRNKDELLLFALHQVSARLQDIMASSTEQATGTDRLVALLSAFLPVDQERQEIVHVWVAFLGYAVGREDLMAEHRRSADELRQVVIAELTALRNSGVLRSDVIPERDANVLLAMSNGISLDSLLHAHPLNPKQQIQAIRRCVEALR